MCACAWSRTTGKLSVRLWDPATGKPLGQLPQKQYLLAMSFSPDGRRLLVGGCNSTTLLWDVARSEPVGPPLKHPNWVMAVAFHPDGQSFLVACDPAVERWDAATRKLLGAPFRHQRGVAPGGFRDHGWRRAVHLRR